MTQVVPIRNFFPYTHYHNLPSQTLFAASQREKRLFSEKNIHIHHLFPARLRNLGIRNMLI